jgi:hypothetical protein
MSMPGGDIWKELVMRECGMLDEDRLPAELAVKTQLNTVLGLLVGLLLTNPSCH